MDTGIQIGDVATWIAACVAFVSAVYSVWWPMRNKPEASWYIMKTDGPSSPARLAGLFGWHTHDGKTDPDEVLILHNDGDGPAFNVDLDAIGADVRIIQQTENSQGQSIIMESPNIHLVQPGDTFRAVLWYEESDRTALCIHWTLQPTRLGKRVYHQMPLKGEFEDQPRRPIPEPRDHAPNLTWYRISHSKMASWIRKRFPPLRSDNPKSQKQDPQ
ncbi:hypothetical protein [Bifidobacterium mongoliense]|uniref:hypothetical protein n=1 Tax=Bifidobacterium mongoliense TaxID=518643 RepID=UPI001269DF84|nr:hypothetical protein [Bifidobacterium mongoliense]